MERKSERGSSSLWPPVLFMAAILGAFALFAGLAFAMSGDGESRDRAERLRAEFEARDARQIEALTTAARRAREELAPALRGMSASLPVGDRPTGRLADSAEISKWRRSVEKAREAFGDPPSGETATNVARGSLVAAVDILESAVLTYDQAARLPESRRIALLERAGGQRDLAVRVWSVGATQLDAINVESGYGHQHVYLPVGGVEGAFGADPAPEGDGAATGREN